MGGRLAHLATRLTARDVWLCELLDEHRMLTTHQLTDLARTCHYRRQAAHL
jgi:hypothetical protein